MPNSERLSHPARAQDRAIAVVAAKSLALALTVAAIGRFVWCARALLLKYPPIWPDEVLFANPAANLVHHGILGTEVLSGTLLGIGRRTYFMPPLYYLYIAAFFYLWGPGVVVMRLSSLVAGLAVMAVTYCVGLRCGLGRSLSLIPVCVVAMDTTFLRAALIGRMEMLTLAFILLALWLAMGPKGSAGHLSSKRSFFAGFVCTLATLTHPFGVVATAAALGGRSLIPGDSQRKVPTPMLAGVLLPVLPWAVYILQDWSGFVSQFGSQVAGKLTYHSTARHPPLPLAAAAAHRLGHFLYLAVAQVAQFGPELRRSDLVMVPLVLATGFLGLCILVVDRRETLALIICQPLIVACAVLGREKWYPVYLVPLTAIGMGALISGAKRRSPRRLACAAMALLLCAWFGLRNVSTTAKIDYVRNVLFKDGTDYFTWCEAISRGLPSGSRVLISVAPDPYFCLANRPDLELREFLHQSLPISPRLYGQYLADADYIIIGPEHDSLMTGNESASPPVDDFAQSRGKLVTVVGTSPDHGYFARIYKVTR